MKAVLLLLVALSTLALCPSSVRCDYHGTTAYRVRTESRNGHQFGVFEHYYWEGGQRKTHSMLMECN